MEISSSSILLNAGIPYAANFYPILDLKETYHGHNGDVS
jgi:hypothetical protein